MLFEACSGWADGKVLLFIQDQQRAILPMILRNLSLRLLPHPPHLHRVVRGAKTGFAKGGDVMLRFFFCEVSV